VNLSVNRTDRVAFFGRTGSGKTTLAKSMLHSCNHPYAVLDPKHRYRDGDVPIKDHFVKKLPEQIIRCEPIGWPAELELWNNAIYEIWKEGDRIIYVDEATLITPPRAILPELGRAIRTGRERNVAVWTGSQRPKDLPSPIFTEAEHFFLFRLQWENDRAKVCSFTSASLWNPYKRMQHEGRSAKHDFIYYGVDDDRMLRVRATRELEKDNSPAQAA